MQKGDVVCCRDSQKSKSKGFYSGQELGELKVSLGEFDTLSGPKDSLFKPLSKCEFGNFSIDGNTLECGARLYYFHFDKAMAKIKSEEPEATLCWKASRQVFDRLKIIYGRYRQSSKSGKTTAYLEEFSNWDSMK